MNRTLFKNYLYQFATDQVDKSLITSMNVEPIYPLNIIAPINSVGYGIFTLGIIKEFQLLNRKFNIMPIGLVNWREVEMLCFDMEIDINNLKNNIVTFNEIESLKKQYDTIIMWHLEELDIIKRNTEDYKASTQVIGFPQFETDYINPDLLRKLNNNLDLIVSSSDWGNNVIKNLSNVNVASNINMFGPCITKGLKNKPKVIGGLFSMFSNKQIFISPGKWESRKDQTSLLNQYSKIDRPESVIFGFWYNVFTGGNKEPIECLTNLSFKFKEYIDIELNDIIRASLWENEKGGQILLFPRINRWIDLMRLYKTGTKVISISKGEGWDLPIVECIGMDMKIFASGNTAHNSYMIDSYLCESKLAFDGKWFFGEGQWYPVKNMKDIYNTLTDTSMNSHSYTILKEICSNVGRL